MHLHWLFPVAFVENLSMQYTEKISAVKIEKFIRKKKEVIFQNFALFLSKNKNQRTNGPVTAHLRSAVYTNKHV